MNSPNHSDDNGNYYDGHVEDNDNLENDGHVENNDNFSALLGHLHWVTKPP